MAQAYDQDPLQPGAQPIHRRHFSEEEEDAILEAAYEASDRGDLDEFARLMKQFPLTPYVAKAAKESLGLEWLQANGYNLLEAEEYFGKSWGH